LIARATKLIEQKNYIKSGYYFVRAGKLLSQLFCVDHSVFNISAHNFNQNCGEGWYAIEAELYFY